MKKGCAAVAVSAACAILFAACGPGVKGEVIATTSLFATGLSQDDDFLYWRTQDAIFRLSKQGGDVATIVEGRSPAAITVSGDRVFWLNQDGVIVSLRSAAKTGGDELVLDPDESMDGTTPMEGNTLRNLTTDGMFLYWSNESMRIRRAPITGGDAITFGPTDIRYSSVAAEGGAVFATTFFGIYRFEEGVDPALVTRGGFDIPDHIALSSPLDDFVYWVEPGDGRANGFVFRAPRIGGGAAAIATREVSPTRPFSDGQNVYFSAGGAEERIRRARVFGSSEADDFSNGHGDLVVDATHVFWIDSGGAIHKALK